MAAGADGVVRGVVWLLLLALVLPALVIHAWPPRLEPVVLMQAVVLLHTAGGLARSLAASRPRLMAFGFWLFCYVWLGLAPAAMLVTGAYPWSYRAGERTAFAASALVEVGLLAYAAGGVLVAWRSASASSAASRSAVPDGPLDRLLGRPLALGRTLLLALVALGVAAVLVPRLGGLHTFFASRQAATAATDAATGSAAGANTADAALTAWGLSVPAFWALLALLHAPRDAVRRDVLARRLRWLLLPLLVALNVVLNNPISQPRFWAGTVLLGLAFSAPALGRPRGFRAAAAAVLVALLVVFPYADYFRNNHRQQIQVTSLASQFTGNGDYDAYQQIQTGLDMAAAGGLRPTNVLAPPLFWVPRAAWPGKPQDTGVQVAHFAGYRFTNLSAPLWIESYLWAGVPAVVLAFGLYGAGGAALDAARLRQRGAPRTIGATLVPALAFYQIILLRGSLLAAAAPLFLLLVIPVLVAGRRRRPAAARAPAATGAVGTAPPLAAERAAG